jgi:membrane fusion protein (multidrug efflux system)
MAGMHSSPRHSASRTPGRGSARLALWLIGALVVGAVGLGVAKTLIFSAGVPKPPAGAVPVAVATVQPATFTEKIEALGTAHSNESVTLTAKVTETVRRIGFTDGQIVKAGDILVELTNDEQAASLQSSRTGLEEAQNNLTRIEALAATGVASKAQLDTARTTRDTAQGRVDAVVAQLADRLIRAPFDGVLGLRSVSPGSLVRPADVITTIDDVGTIKIDFAIPEIYLGVIRTGLSIEAKAAAYPERPFRGEIEAIDSRVDPVTRAVTVRARVPNPDYLLRSGMLMTVEIIRSQKTAPAVPERAILALGDQVFVYAIDNDVAQRLVVSTGTHQDGMVEITSGLRGDERIVVDGVHRLRPGQKIDLVELNGTVVRPQKPRPQS